jgi:hypothetical protein
MKFIIRKFILDKHDNEQAAGNAGGEANHIYDGVYFLFNQTAKGDLQIVFYHQVVIFFDAVNWQSLCHTQTVQ